ncbi:MAG TPA: GNVR domain-containing protein [Candidatus Eisenbacteria bacterium]|nr:GNVR domain-containing protein [Candidatus Eisenbacteria bacterium]
MSSPPRPDAGFDLRVLVRAAVRRWPLVLGAAAVAGALTLGVTFLMPKWYRATSVILPPEESDLLSNMSIAERALTKFPAFGILEDYFTPADVYKAILASRTVGEDLMQQFDLQQIYRKRSVEKTLKELKSHTKVKLNPDGTIAVSVEDRDPRRAAAMANAYLVALDRYNIEKRNTQAHRTRVFLERRVAETDSAMRTSEAMLRNYQEAHHAVVPTSVAGADVSSSANLMARQIALQVRLGMLRSYLREDNEQVIQTRTELDQLNERIATLPALQTDVARLLRDTKVQEQLYLLLTAELEQARIRETMDTPTVQLLDAAVPPERQSRPRRLTMAAAAALLAFAASVAWVAVREGDEVSPQ